MNLSAIQAFVHTAEEGSISQAAKKMNKNRVQVSQWISSLEDEWNLALFDRRGQKPELTPAGKKLRHLCQQLLEAEDNVSLELRSLGPGNLDRLDIGVSYLLPPALLKDICKTITEVFPGICVRLIQRRDEELLALSEAQELDLAIVCFMNAFSVPDSCEPLGSIGCTAVCAPNHPLASMGQLGSKTLLGHYFISMPVTPDIPHWEIPGIGKRIEVDNLFIARQLALSGEGFAALPNWLIGKELKSGELVRINHAEAELNDAVGLIPSTNPQLLPLRQPLIDIVEEYCRCGFS